MATVPTAKKAQVFDKQLDGIYGQFKTSQSFSLDYLLTTLKVNKLNYLETASDVLPLDVIDFEQIVQRDIDYVRVQKEIVENYLEKGSGRVVFFPPLLVTVIGLENGNTPISHYSDISRDFLPGEFVATYDVNRFQLRLPLSNSETAHSISDGKTSQYYYNYAATLHYNSEKVKLVVIDGQHRLTALKKLILRGQKHLIENIDLPICVFFSPDALKASQPQESLVKDMRELFVTINKEAKEVSGHFIWLLKDKSLAALSVRGLGDAWKRDGGGLTFLHQLEWNQRDAAKANQAQKKYSITTVSIVAETLSKYIFSDPERCGYTYKLLCLEEVAPKLRKSSTSVAAESISEQVFDLEQIDILKAQIKLHLTPSLTALLQEPSPYRLVRQEFVRAVRELDKEISRGRNGAQQFKDEVLVKFRAANELDQTPVRDMEKQFSSMFASEAFSNIDFFRRNIFQQGLIRAWAKVVVQVYGIIPTLPEVVATAFVKGLELVCFSTKQPLFHFYREYTQNLIYRGSKIIVNNVAKNAVRDLILATLANPKVRKAIVSGLTSSEKKKALVDSALELLGNGGGTEYLRMFRDCQLYHTERNWRFLELHPEEKAFLEQRLGSKTRAEVKEFRDKIEEIVETKVDKARSVLANLLNVPSATLDEVVDAPPSARKETENE